MNTTLRTLRRACLALALCGLALTARSQQADEQDKALTPDEKTYILSKFWSEVKYNFVYFNQIGDLPPKEGNPERPASTAPTCPRCSKHPTTGPSTTRCAASAPC